MRILTYLFISTAITILLFSAYASADTIITTDGRKLEGKIVRQTEEFVEIEMAYGSVKVPLSKVDKIEKGKTTLEIFEDKYAKSDKKDAKALLELAEWCRENKLGKQEKELYEEVLKLEPGNDKAGEGLGYEKKDGAWVKLVKRAKPEKKKPKRTVARKKEKPLDAEPEIPIVNKEDEEIKKLCAMPAGEIWTELQKAQDEWNAYRAYQCASVLISEKNQNTMLTWFKVAWALGEMGDYRENIRATYKAYGLAPPEKKDWATMYMNQQLGYAFDRMGDYEKAEEHYLKSYEKNKGYWWISCALATNYKHMERYEDSLKYVEISLQVSPGRVGSSLVKATCLILKGNKEEGRLLIRACERGLAHNLANGDKTVEFGGGQGIYLAEAWCAFGDYDKALFWLGEHIYKFCKFEKDRNYVKREVMRLPLLKPLHDNEFFKEMARIPKELDEEEWEYGVVKKGKAVKQGEEVADLSKKAKNENVLPPTLAPKDWYVIRTKHYVCISNSLRDRLKELAHRLEMIFFEYRKFFKCTTDIEETYTVKMFKNRREFQEYASEHGVEGFAAAYFSYKDKELVLYDSFSVGMGLKAFSAVYHEAAHQFICHHLGKDVPIWLHEAVAQYFEYAAYNRGRFAVGAKDFKKVQPVQNALMNDEKLYIDRMLKMTRNEFYSGNVSLNYATAYCFLYFLLDYDKSTMKLLADFVKELKDTGNAEKAFQASFGKINIFQLERQFHKYMLKGK